MRFFYSILLSLLYIALTGCVQSMETLQSWYYFSQEKCPVTDCAYCKNADHYLLKIDTHTSRALNRKNSSSGYTVREVDHDARPICRDDCSYCNKIKKYYTQDTSMDRLIPLQKDLELFTAEALPEIYRERNSLSNKYSKIKDMLSEIRKVKDATNDDASLKLCIQQEEKLLKSSQIIAKKYNSINAEIEKIYVQYKIAQQNNSLDIINDISLKSDEILQDLKSIHNEIPNL